MTDPQPLFSTFCHISQYGDTGYRVLPRMIAMSRPSLWSPSSVILNSGSSGISPKTFLRYVEDGEIRIFGRYEWLNDPQWRNGHRWSGTAWDNNIDGTIRRICTEDSSKPLDQRRVAVAPPERGYEWADSYLTTHPDEISRWQRVLRSEKRRRAIPGGTREAALLDIDKPFLAARRVLRDAYNHGQAISYSRADAPFLVQQTHREFLRILAEAPASDDYVGPGHPAESSAPNKPADLDLWFSDLTSQLLEILAELDVHARDRGDEDSLDRFIRGPGRPDLMQWMTRISAILRQVDPRNVNGLLLKQLKSDLGYGHFYNVFEELLTRKEESAIGAVGMLSTIIGLATDPIGLSALLGVAASAYPLGKGLIRQLGYAPATFSGPQWPFLYTYGKQPKRRQLKQVRYVLDELDRRESGAH